MTDIKTEQSFVTILFRLSTLGRKKCFVQQRPYHAIQRLYVGPNNPHFDLAVKFAQFNTEGQLVIDTTSQYEWNGIPTVDEVLDHCPEVMNWCINHPKRGQT